jgi:hypothetical protein
MCETTEFAFAAGSDVRRPMTAIRTSARDVERIRELIRVAGQPDERVAQGLPRRHLRREGSSGGRGRYGSPTPIAPSSAGRTDLVALRLRRRDRTRRGTRTASSTCASRWSQERLRFFHLTDPAITRKRSIEASLCKSDAETRVVSVEPLGSHAAVRHHDGTGDFIATAS